MSSWSEGRRPITLAILALGGEGGGVLADWIVATAERAGFTAQNTSVAGVAQRTGATVYYVEMFPPLEPSGNGQPVRSEPVMSIFPTPGEVDVVIASELMESGRAIQRGFSTADRTTLITSTNRVYSIDEKIALGDGRVDDTKLIDAARRASKQLVAADFAEMAEQAGSVISASLFGALAGSGALPFSREHFEESIKASGKGVEASLAAFAAGFDTAAHQIAPPADASEEAAGGSQRVDPVAPKVIELPIANGAATSSRTTEQRKADEEAERNRIAAANPASLVGPALRDLAEQVRDLPGQARSMILHGLVRTAVYQDRAYAERYLQRVRAFAAVDPDPDGDARLTLEAARHIALWMCYQDTIQVAAQKVRMRRMDRIRKEAKVRDNQLFEVREFLHPQIDEIIDTLPTWLGEPLSKSPTFRRIVRATTHKGMILNTNSVVGYTLLTTMARVRPLRPRSVRFAREQAAIEQWIALALDAARHGDPALATEIVECQRVLKGYGSTYEHGTESFTTLMGAARRLIGQPDAAARLARLRDAALADEDGTMLQAKYADEVPQPA